MLSLNTLRRRALNAGYELQKGKQRYLHRGWGLVRDYAGNTYDGYQVYDQRLGAVVAGLNDINDHDLDLCEAVDALRRLGVCV